MSSPVLVYRGLVDIEHAIEAMQAFTAARSTDAGGRPDEIWLCEHRPVYTQGLAGKPQHLLDAQRDWYAANKMQTYGAFSFRRRQPRQPFCLVRLAP